MADQEGKKAKLSFDIEEVQDLVTAAVVAAAEQGREANKETTLAIVQALLDARKPYIDPKQKALETMTREQNKNQAKQIKRDFEAGQDNCPHKKGSSPLSWYNDPNNSSFGIHTLDTGEIVGICTNCTKVISSLDPTHRVFFANARGTNIRSAAGVRSFADPLAAQRAGSGRDLKEIFVDDDGNIVKEPVAVAQ
jgi:hypothetical protein